jgi:hypothetical protein
VVVDVPLPLSERIDSELEMRIGQPHARWPFRKRPAHDNCDGVYGFLLSTTVNLSQRATPVHEKLAAAVWRDRDYGRARRDTGAVGVFSKRCRTEVDQVYWYSPVRFCVNFDVVWFALT